MEVGHNYQNASTHELSVDLALFFALTLLSTACKESNPLGHPYKHEPKAHERHQVRSIHPFRDVNNLSVLDRVCDCEQNLEWNHFIQVQEKVRTFC